MSLNQLRDMLSKTEGASAQERRKIGRSLGYVAMNLEKSGAQLSEDEIAVVSKALMEGARAHGWPQKYLTSNARLMRRRRGLMGLSDPTTLTETSRMIDVEMGAICVLDAETELPEEFFEVGGKPFLRAMNEGLFFCVGLGMDCGIRVQLRVLSGEPLEPSEAEFGRLRGATFVGRLKAASGRVRAFGGGAWTVEVAVPSTDLLVAAYLIGTYRNPKILVLMMADSGQFPSEPLIVSPELPLS